jgi:hypothetical protein
LYLPTKSTDALQWGILIVMAGLLVHGCSRNHDKGYVARVDQSVLTERELVAGNDSSGNARRQNLEFVNNWIATELLYQEAVRRGLSDTDEIRRQLDATQKHLAINALLDRELFGKDSTLVTESTLLDLYNSDNNEFRLQEDVAQLSFVLFSDRDAANEFRSTILRGASWHDALLRVQRDSFVRPTLLQVVDRHYFTKATLYPEELWRLSRTLNKEEVSFVVATGAGFYVLIVHGLKHQGEMPDWDYIKDEVRERVLIEQRRKLYDSLLARLRAEHSVEIRLEPADSSAAHK